MRKKKFSMANVSCAGKANRSINSYIPSPKGENGKKSLIVPHYIHTRGTGTSLSLPPDSLMCN